MTRPAAIVAGASSGIGRATAVALAARGFDLAICARRGEQLEETARMARAQCPEGRIFTRVVDIGAPGAATQFAAASAAELGRIETLVYAAGDAPAIPVSRTTRSEFDRVMAVNAGGASELVAACWDGLLAQGRGCVVLLSSLSASDPFPNFLAYAAAKGALSSIARALHAEGRAHGVRAFAIELGGVETALLRRLVSEAEWPSSQTLSPEEVAAVVIDCISGKRDSDCGHPFPLMRT